jgi:hypothetical protein
MALMAEMLYIHVIFGWETPRNDVMRKSTSMNPLKTKIEFLFCRVLPDFRKSTSV